MSKLEDYYKGDDIWIEYSNSFDKYWTNSDYQMKLLELLNNQIDLAKVIFYHNSDSSIQWVNSKIPALNGLTPLACLNDTELTKRLKECLLRFP